MRFRVLHQRERVSKWGKGEVLLTLQGLDDFHDQQVHFGVPLGSLGVEVGEEIEVRVAALYSGYACGKPIIRGELVRQLVRQK